MTKFYNWLGSVGLAALMGVMLFGAAGIYGASEVEAQSPPDPPARFVGTVIVDGEPAAAGTTIEARVGGNACGTTSVFMDGSDARYSLDVVSASPNNPGCGSDGATVSFYVGGVAAQQTGAWINYDLNVLNLTVVPATVTPTPTDDDDDDATVTPTPTDDDADDNGTPPVTVTATPGPPATGTGTSAGGFTAVWLLVALGLGAAAFGAAGTVAARRK